MKFSDVLLIFGLATIPLTMPLDLMTRESFELNRLTIFLALIFCLIYFSIKTFHLLSTTYSEKTFFKTSVNVETNDVLTGLFWGLVIYQYYELDKAFLLIWLLIGLMIFIIGFTAGAAIHETKGIRLTKKEKWVKWSEIDKLYINEVFFGFGINETRQYPVLANKVRKQEFDNLRDGIVKVAEEEQISLRLIPDKSSLLLGEMEFEENGTALDDFVARIKNFVLIEAKGLLFSERNQLINWSDIINIEVAETIIIIEYNPTNPRIKKLYNDDFNNEDWMKLSGLLKIEN